MKRMDCPSQTDEQLVSIFQKGERSSSQARDAFTQLYDRHAPNLLAFLSSRVHRHEMEDVNQVVWQRVWEKLGTSFQGGSFRGWLFTIARHYVIDERRKRRPQELPNGEQFPDVTSWRPDAALLESERTELLRRCLERLDQQAAAIVKGRLSGEAYEVLSKGLGVTPTRAHRLFHDAKEKVRDCIEHAW